jgi:hypothetical protein
MASLSSTDSESLNFLSILSTRLSREQTKSSFFEKNTLHDFGLEEFIKIINEKRTSKQFDFRDRLKTKPQTRVPGTEIQLIKASAKKVESITNNALFDKSNGRNKRMNAKQTFEHIKRCIQNLPVTTARDMILDSSTSLILPINESFLRGQVIGLARYLFSPNLAYSEDLETMSSLMRVNSVIKINIGRMMFTGVNLDASSDLNMQQSAEEVVEAGQLLRNADQAKADAIQANADADAAAAAKLKADADATAAKAELDKATASQQQKQNEILAEQNRLSGLMSQMNVAVAQLTSAVSAGDSVAADALKVQIAQLQSDIGSSQLASENMRNQITAVSNQIAAQNNILNESIRNKEAAATAAALSSSKAQDTLIKAIETSTTAGKAAQAVQGKDSLSSILNCEFNII